MIKRVCLISNPRTGSNRFCEIVGSIPSVRGRYEIFHPENAWGVSAKDVAFLNLHNDSNYDIFNDSNQSQFTEFRRNRPAEFLNLLSKHDQERGSKYLFFKIFNRHLATDKLLKLASSGNIQFVFLTRNTIDMYISALKAIEIKKYSGVDTTNIKPKFSVNNFLGFQQENIKWFSSSYLVSKEVCDPIIIRYEDIFNSETNEMDQVHRSLSSIICQRPEIDAGTGLQLQDRSNTWQEKISNPDSLLRLMQEKRVIPDISKLLL